MVTPNVPRSASTPPLHRHRRIINPRPLRHFHWLHNEHHCFTLHVSITLHLSFVKDGPQYSHTGHCFNENRKGRDRKGREEASYGTYGPPHNLSVTPSASLLHVHFGSTERNTRRGRQGRELTTPCEDFRGGKVFGTSDCAGCCFFLWWRSILYSPLVQRSKSALERQRTLVQRRHLGGFQHHHEHPNEKHPGRPTGYD